MEKNKVERISVDLIDQHSVSDKFISGSGTPFPKNRVQIHEKKNDGVLYRPNTDNIILPRSLDHDPEYGKIEDTTNLIVYTGRSWLMRRAFNKALKTGDVDYTRWINWFGLGTGGAASTDPLQPYEPVLSDYGLGGDRLSHASVGAGSSRVTDTSNREYHAFDTSYPIFISDINVDATDMETGATNLHTDPVTAESRPDASFLIALVRVTIESNEYNGGLTDDDYLDINEAGLFTSISSTVGEASRITPDPEMFARVCFSTIRKSSSREIVFSWYIYF